MLRQALTVVEQHDDAARPVPFELREQQRPTQKKKQNREQARPQQSKHQARQNAQARLFPQIKNDDEPAEHHEKQQCHPPRNNAAKMQFGVLEARARGNVDGQQLQQVIHQGSTFPRAA